MNNVLFWICNFKFKYHFCLFFMCVLFASTSCNNKCKIQKSSISVISKDDGNFRAPKTNTSVKIDGLDTDSIWNESNWYTMNYLWMGEPINSFDYNGKFKLAWDTNHLYVLVEIIDDYLNPTLKDGLENYWKGDYVEIFIDEDYSGGDHKSNHQAFAYHIATDGHVIDKSTLNKTTFFDNHVNVKRTQAGNKYLWELAIKIFNDQFDENSLNNKPIIITNQKKIGFSIAYGDNDGKKQRDNFMGSKKNHGINNDEGYVNSDVFGSIIFID